MPSRISDAGRGEEAGQHTDSGAAGDGCELNEVSVRSSASRHTAGLTVCGGEREGELAWVETSEAGTSAGAAQFASVVSLVVHSRVLSSGSSPRSSSASEFAGGREQGDERGRSPAPPASLASTLARSLARLAHWCSPGHLQRVSSVNSLSSGPLSTRAESTGERERCREFSKPAAPRSASLFPAPRSASLYPPRRWGWRCLNVNS